MSDTLVWYTGNRDPSISETITTDGTPVNLTGATVKFKMRAVGSTTLKVNATATVVDPAAGTVRYDWQAADVDTAGQYLVWWTVTLGGKDQDVGEALIEFRPHGEASHLYTELEELKTALEMTGYSYADQELNLARAAASRAVEAATGRRYWLDTGTDNERLYTASSLTLLPIDDLVTLTTVEIDRSGSGVYGEAWTEDTDFILEPPNAALEYPVQPYTMLRTRFFSGRWLPYTENGVKVTGQFGWPTVPSDIRAATSILAAKLLRRIREAPFGIVTVGVDEGAAMRIARADPDVVVLLAPFNRHQPFA